MKMTKEQYVQSVSYTDWHEVIEKLASQDLQRVFSLGAVQEAIREEFNNDVYEYFEKKYEEIEEEEVQDEKDHKNNLYGEEI